MEYGGEFHSGIELPEGPPELPRGTLWGSGRAALLALLESRRWKRIWLPTYICSEVTDALARFPVAFYRDHPLLAPAGLPPSIVPGDVVLRVNYFGLRGAEEIARSTGDVIEDHTHDPNGPWARGSRAPFAIASLRKTFPVADGGLLWSPTGSPLPEEREATAAHLAAADAKMLAMDMKAQYLRGGDGAKEDYQALFRAGESRIGSLSGPHPDTRAAIVRASPVALAARRRAAHEKLGRATPWTVAPRGDPFALVLDLGSGRRRDRVLRALVAEKVFPSILWPLRFWKSDREARAVSRRLLTVPCDLRYSDAEVARVASLLGKAVHA